MLLVIITVLLQIWLFNAGKWDVWLGLGEGGVDGGVGSEGVGVRLDGAFKLRCLHVRSVAGRVGTF